MVRKSFSVLSASLAAAVLALGAVPATAQQGPVQAIADNNTLLTVSAQGSTDSAPDLAVFTAGVTTQAATANAALAENSTKMAAVIAALKRAGIAERDIQTSNLSVNPVYSNPERDAMIAARARSEPYIPPPPEQQMQRIIGYNVTNNVMVRQRDLGNFGRVIDTLVAAGANQVNGPNFQLEDQEDALDAARREAMREARERAELYAGAAGLRIVRIVSIAEGGGYYQPRVMFRTASVANAPPPPPPAPVQPGELELTASVTVLYELAP